MWTEQICRWAIWIANRPWEAWQCQERAEHLVRSRVPAHLLSRSPCICHSEDFSDFLCENFLLHLLQTRGLMCIWRGKHDAIWTVVMVISWVDVSTVFQLEDKEYDRLEEWKGKTKWTSKNPKGSVHSRQDKRRHASWTSRREKKHPSRLPSEWRKLVPLKSRNSNENKQTFLYWWKRTASRFCWENVIPGWTLFFQWRCHFSFLSWIAVH